VSRRSGRCTGDAVIARFWVAVALLPGCFLARGGESKGCPKDRGVELGLQEEVAKYAGCETLAGVTIRTGATVDVLPLRELEEITGDLVVGPTVGVDTIAFNGLVRVGGTIRVVSNGSLRGLFFPRLESVGRIEVESNVVLTTISVPRLVTVANSVVIADNNGLELISASALTSLGGELVIVDHPKLNLVELPRLARLQAVRLEDNPKLPPEVAEQLQRGTNTP
jgi:hypothetical protein